MRKLAQIGSLALAETLTGALAAYTVPTVFAGEDAAFQRNEDTPDVVTTVDDDDSDTGRSGESNTDTGTDDTSASTGTGNSNTGIR